MHRVTLHAGREKSLRLRHPWVFSGAIAAVEGTPVSGETVAVCAADGAFLASAAWSPASAIRARVWTFDAQRSIDASFVAARIRTAVAARTPLLDAAHTGCRLVHAESDGLPGVIADLYGDVVVLQLRSSGAEAWRDAIVATLIEATGCAAVYERSDAEVRTLEGLPARTGVAAGTLPDTVRLVEDGLAYDVDVASGQKTGFYLDQRDNRRRVRAIAAGRDVLDCFCYTGGFTVAALAGGARSVVAVAILGATVAGPAVAQDPTKVDAKHYKVEFENDQVRVLRITYGPKEKSVMHEHPGSVAVYLTDGKAKFTLPDGKTMDAPVKAGTTQWAPAGKHLPENVGDKPFELVLVELKGKPATK